MQNNRIYRVSQKKRTVRMLQSVLGSKTLSGHNDRNLRMGTWVRSAVFDPRTLCSILIVRFFLGYPVGSKVMFITVEPTELPGLN